MRWKDSHSPAAQNQHPLWYQKLLQICTPSGGILSGKETFEKEKKYSIWKSACKMVLFFFYIFHIYINHKSIHI